MCITTNPIGTFAELFQLFVTIASEMELAEALKKISDYIDHRATQERIVEEFRHYGLHLIKSHADSTNMRFADATALLNHGLIRVGFREYWEQMINEKARAEFFKRLLDEIDKVIAAEGEFKMTIPMLYLEFAKG